MTVLTERLNGPGVASAIGRSRNVMVDRRSGAGVDRPGAAGAGRGAADGGAGVECERCASAVPL
jgi:hypothetical protein